MVAALALAGLYSCSDEEVQSVVENEEVATTPTVSNFRVTEEKQVSAEELFASSVSGLEQLGAENLIDNVRKNFEEKCSELPVENGTRGIGALLFKTARIEYQTTDQAGEEVTASALIVYPLLKKISEVMLINHGTQIGIAMIPTKYTSVEAIMAATGALCILPDYIGLGSSASHPDLYLNEDVHGRTSVDALLALLDYAEAKNLPLKSDYKTTIIGYSQGGAVSLASLRRVQQLDEATQSRLHLQKVFCGDGPYDLRATFESYMEDFENGKDIALGSVIPTVINSMFNSYPDEMADINYEDFFTTWALSTGVPQAIRENSETVSDMMLKFMNHSLDEILNMDYITNYPEHLNRLLGLMDRQNLCHGWTPKYPLKLLHCHPDGVVPFANYEEAVAGLSNSYVETEVVSVSESLNPLLQHIYGMLVMINEVLGE